jgi:hypothetical protein
VVIILLNNKGNPSLDEITKGLAAIVLSQPYTLPKERIAVTVKDSILKQYIGEYQLAPAVKITVTFENDTLKGQVTGQPQFEMFAEKDNFFFLKVVDAQIEFTHDEHGNISQLILYQGGRTMPAKKIK